MNAEVLNSQGIAALRAGRFSEAADLLNRAVAMSPRNVEILNNLATALAMQNRTDEALPIATTATTIDPQNADAWEILGNVLMDKNDLAGAIAAYQRGAAIKPNVAINQRNLGNALAKADKLESSAEAFGKAVALEPNSAEAHHQLASVLYGLGQFDRAADLWRKAIALQPDHAAAHWNLAQVLLLRGEFSSGWPEFEWRMKIPAMNLSPAHIPRPMWDGRDLSGKTILLYSEQGFGDTLQFCRYIPMVAAKCAKVILTCSRSLTKILRQSNLGAEVIANDISPPPFDTFCPLPSLPGVFRTEINSIPATIPYIHAEKTKTDLGSSRKIGVVWAGSPRHSNDRNRSLPVGALDSLKNVENAVFYSLQKERAVESGLQLIDSTSQLHDFADTADLIAKLDLVISVDTAVAHLAGAMGKPVWLLLPFVPDWRWMLGRDHSPWYPTMRLFRQPRRGDWQTPIRQIVAELGKFENPR